MTTYGPSDEEIDAAYESGALRWDVSVTRSLKRIADALEKQNELMEQANKIGERNVAAAERIELAQHEYPPNRF